jgi:hypothetical protein
MRACLASAIAIAIAMQKCLMNSYGSLLPW